MRADLGTWPNEQAEVLVRVLRDQGVDAAVDAEGARARVTVEAAHASRATTVMSAAMDQLAAAARRPASPHADDSHVTSAAEPTADDHEEGPPLVMERFRRMAPVIGVLVATMMVALMVPGWFKIVAIVVAVAGYVLLRVGGSADGAAAEERHRPDR